MEESILFSSPNWFQPTVLAVSIDRWLVYGGPNKSLCVLEPLHKSHGVIKGDSYRSHVQYRAHAEKIVSVDISPEWPNKKEILSGSSDGTVKLWELEEVDNKVIFKSTLTDYLHRSDKEELVGIEYSGENFAVTVGSLGNTVKWDLKSNVVKSYSHFLKVFRPTCMSCSPHTLLNVAVGTKQGVIIVLDLNGNGKILYKVRGQDAEIVGVSWCPQFEVSVKQHLEDFDKKASANERIYKIRQEAELSEQILDQSGMFKTLPEDSFDESVVQEDDMFDIYKDYETDVFGPKKYEPEEILVKVKEEVKADDNYLKECKKLSEDILRRKNEPEPSIASLVDALENVGVENKIMDDSNGLNYSTTIQPQADNNEGDENETSKGTLHAYKHLVATLGKNGSVRIWASGGNMIGICHVPTGNKNQKDSKHCSTLLWCKANILLVADGKNQLLCTNPLRVNCKNKFLYEFVHAIHKRGLYSIASDAPRVQTIGNTNRNEVKNWSVWTIAQDRNIVRYSLIEKEQLIYSRATCGGFLYNIQSCPYDARKIAVGVGDGAVRVLEIDVADDDDKKLCINNVSSYWQNVQGKVLTVAWHPTKENLIAFGTAESRIGLIDANGKVERAARTLMPSLSGGIYSLCWGEGDQLFASAGGKLMVYRTSNLDQAPELIKVYVEGQLWDVTCVRRRANMFLVGNMNGAVAVLKGAPYYTELAANYLYNKIIYNAEWHPQQTSEADEESPYKNLIAVTGIDKENTISILEYGDKEDGSKQLQLIKVLTGHKCTVLQIAWNPHRDGLLASTSQDKTVRVWDVVKGSCLSMFSGHNQNPICVIWCPRPQLHSYLFSGGSDSCLRLWSMDHHPYNSNEDVPHHLTRKEKRKIVKEYKDLKAVKVVPEVQTPIDQGHKAPKKFLMPIIHKQLNSSQLRGARKMFENYKAKSSDNIHSNNGIGADVHEVSEETTTQNETNTTTANVKDELSIDREVRSGVDFIKLFGSTNDVNEVLDMESAEHIASGGFDAWIMLSIFRGRIDSMIQFANQKNLLCPYLVSLTPCVSFKYWKEVSQLYVAQIDRVLAKGHEEKISLFKQFGSVVFRKAGILLSLHDVKGAIALLLEHRLYKEAYMLCRTRHMDSIAEDVIRLWLKECYTIGNWTLATICHLALGELSQAATYLGKSNDPDCLCLAADMAKFAGHKIFADQMQEKKSNIQSKELTTEDSLGELPTKMELLLREEAGGSSEVCGEVDSVSKE